jgi:tetratricopeptide (TPR) repeat protein
MAEISRIEDLQQRLVRDSTSIAFAQLAEELRRAGQYGQSVEVCRAGLAIYPDYLSARITLARALTALGELAEAERQFNELLTTSPESVAALNGLAIIHGRRAETRKGESPSSSGKTGPTQPQDADTDLECARSRRGVTRVGENDIVRVLRTLTALEAWLAAIHVARANRQA